MTSRAARKARDVRLIMAELLDDLKHEWERDFASHVFDKTSPAGIEENKRYDALKDNIDALTTPYDKMLLAVDNVINARQSLVDWRNHGDDRARRLFPRVP